MEETREVAMQLTMFGFTAGLLVCVSAAVPVSAAQPFPQPHAVIQPFRRANPPPSAYHVPPLAMPYKIPVLQVRPPQFGDSPPYISQSTIGAVMTLPGTVAFATGITFDSVDGNFYVVTNNIGATLYQVSPNGSQNAIASLPLGAFSLTHDPNTNLLYVTDVNNHRILAVSISGQITVLAGGTRGTADGQGSAAQFQQPTGIVVNAQDHNLYVTDLDRIRKVTTGGAVTTLTAPGSIGPPPGIFASGLALQGITYDAHDGKMYVADPYSNEIHQVTLAGAVTTAAGQCVVINNPSQCDGVHRDGKAAFALFASPTGIVFSSGDNALYLTDTGNNQIRKLAVTGIVSTLAGDGHLGFLNGIGLAAEFGSPAGLAYYPNNGDLYVNDSPNNSAIRTVVTRGSIPPPPKHSITMYDIPSIESFPSAIAVTADCSVWFSETRTLKIGRRFANGVIVEYALPATATQTGRMIVAPDGNVWMSDLVSGVGNIARIAGNGVVTEFPLTQSTGFGPVASDITVGPDGNIWFIDQNLHGIGFMTLTGAVREFAFPNMYHVGSGFGYLWTSAPNVIDKASTTGKIVTQYNYFLQLGDIQPGPDKKMWFTQSDALGTVVGSHILTYPLPMPPSGVSRQVSFLVTGADGALWFTEAGVGGLGRLTPGGVFTDRVVPAARSGPAYLAKAPDGSIWFADFTAHKIGRFK